MLQELQKPDFVETEVKVKPDFVETEVKVKPDFVETEVKVKPDFVETEVKVKPHSEHIFTQNKENNFCAYLFSLCFLLTYLPYTVRSIYM